MNRFRPLLASALVRTVAVASICLPATLSAQSWSAVADFTTAANPNGQWSYGVKNAVDAATLCLMNNVSSCSGWGSGRDLGASSACASTACYPYTTIAVSQGVDWLFMHPRSQASVRYNTTRWTAPAAGVYEITTLFRKAPYNGNTIDCHRRVNSATPSLHSQMGVAGVVTFPTVSETLAAGDTVDFMIGDDGNGDFGDWGQLQATIRVPALAQAYGIGCGTPTISAVGAPTPGNSTFGVRVSNAQPNALALFAFAATPGALPLLPGPCTFLLGPDSSTLVRFTDGAGVDTFSLAIPAGTSFLGVSFYMQWATWHSPGGAFGDLVDFSGGLRIQIGI